jgi:ferricrocin synthase
MAAEMAKTNGFAAKGLAILNEHRRTLPGPKLLHELVAENNDEDTAIEFLLAEDVLCRLSYGEFRDLSQQLTEQVLQALGRDSSPSVVPVVIPQSPELYLAWRAISQAGHCICPISPDVPPERLKFILTDVGAQLVIHDDSSSQLVVGVRGRVKSLVISLKLLRTCHDSRPRDRTYGLPTQSINSDTPAYIMYTSGSTGLPKGVPVSHKSVTQSILAHDEHIPNFKRFLQFASPTFDVSIFEIWFPFYRGATLVGRVRETMLGDLPGTIRDLNADAAELTPTVASTLLRTRSAAPGLKLLLTIGEMLNTQVIQEFGGDKNKASMLYAMYGPTEAAIHCTIAPRLSSTASVRQIGQPLSTVSAFVLNRDPGTNVFRIARQDEEGELAIAGQLAYGYLNRDEQTEEAFIDLPSHGKVYRTGDQAICRSHGQLEILGRIAGGQVKLRGQRVELGEIEEIASKVSGVSQAIASVVEDSLVLSCHADRHIDSSAISAMCRKWLLPFMRPTEIILHHSPLPTLPSGKVDRKGIADGLLRRGRGDSTGDAAFESETEATIAQVVSRYLRRNVRRDDDLWRCGLDSLRAIRIASELRGRFPSIVVASVLRCASVKEIAEMLSSRSTETQNGHHDSLIEDSDAWESIQRGALKGLSQKDSRSVESVSPCTPMQLGMLAETVLKPDLNFNHIHLQLHAGTDFEQLQRAFEKLAQARSMLRSGFVTTDDERMPFVQVRWTTLESRGLNLAHPFQIRPDTTGNKSCADVVIHHALYDGWSWDLIMNDLNRLLSHEQLPTRTPFEAVSRSLRHRLPKAFGDASLEYWTDLLTDMSTAPFPSLIASSPSSPAHHTIQRSLDVKANDLRKLSTDLRVTRQAILQASWATLLSCYADSEDIVFGTVISGRHAGIPGIEETIGPCLATIPTRLDLSKVATAIDLLSYVQRQNLESLGYYDTPLRDIQKQSGLDPAQRLFDTLVVWQEQADFEPRLNQLVWTSGGEDRLDYSLVLEVEIVDEACNLKLTYDTGLVPQKQAVVLAEQLNVLLSRMLAQPSCLLEDLWPAQASQVLSLVNPTFQAYSGSADLVKPVRKTASADPKRVALRFVSDFDPISRRLTATELTYPELVQKASNVATHLARTYSIAEDDLVCIISHKSIELYVAILAAVLAGAGYMCVNPDTPRTRMQQIIDQAKPAVVLTGQRISGKDLNCRQSEIMTLIEQHPKGHSEAEVCPHGKSLAYAVFTSGTTGVPKGILMTRRNLMSHIDHLRSVYPHESGTDSLLQACSPAFDVSVFEIFWTWHMGMTLVAASNDELFRDLERFIDAVGVTHLSMTPTVAALVDPDKVPKLKMLVTAGEPMNSKVFSQWAGRGLYQGYGPSETTNICNIRPDVARGDAQNNVGVAFSNTSMFVCRRLARDRTSTDVLLALDDFRPVPRGATGEIWIGGDQVGRGYIDPVLTAHSFLMHPDYGWLYRSGDIGRVLADGTFVILGREDDQAKLRGQRIELGEINNTLLHVDGVVDALSLVRSGQDGQKLITFVAHNDRNGFKKRHSAAQHLFDVLNDRLPAYMIPDIIMSMRALPLTVQGKVDKKKMIAEFEALSTTEQDQCRRESSDTMDTEPMTGQDRSIANALAITLSIPPESIRRETSFYSLGLDSLSVIRFGKNLRAEGLPLLDVSTILKNPSIRKLSRIISQTNHEQRSPQHANWKHLAQVDSVKKLREQLSDTHCTIEKVLPCTSLQISMLSASSHANGASYRNRLTFKIKGHLTKIKRAWLRVMQRQQLLRTVFVEQDELDVPYLQVVLKDLPLPWVGQKHTANGLRSPTEAWSRLQVEQSNDDATLILDVHHALYDAEGLKVLLQEVETCYYSRDLEPVVHFDQYLHHMESTDKAAASAFWRPRLADVRSTRVTDLLKNSARVAARQGGFAEKVLTVRLAEMQQHARKQSITVLAYIQAAVAQMLKQYSQTDDVTFGNVYSGRNITVDGVDRIAGPCFNTLPIRAHGLRYSTNRTLLRKLHQENLEMMQFQTASLRELQREYSPDGRPLFDFLLLLQTSSHELDSRIWELVEEQGDMDFPFILEVVASATSDTVCLNLHSTVASDAVLADMLSTIDRLLTHVVRYPEALIQRDPEMPWFIRSNDKYNVNGRASRSSTASHGNGMLSETEQQVAKLMLTLARDPARAVRELASATTIFKLGLDSISAVRLASKLRSAGYKITSSDILESPSLGEIASLCTNNSSRRNSESDIQQISLTDFSQKHMAMVSDRCGDQSSNISAVRPCTPLQCGILSQYIRSSGRLYYNTMKLKLDHNVSLSDMRLAWEAATKEHEMLRTGFVECDDPICSFLMVTYERFKPPIVVKANGSSAAGMNGSKGDLAIPPWGVSLDEDSRTVELSMLHALYDAKSLDHILASVARAYLNHSSEQIVSAGSIDAILPSFFKSNGSQAAVTFWKRPANVIEPTMFPDLNIHKQAGHDFQVTQDRLSRSLADVSEACAGLGCTLQVVCQAAWSQLLSEYTGQDRVTFGLLLSGRDYGDERDDVVFPCINTLPCTVATNRDKKQLLRDLASTTSGLLRNQRTPLSSIKRWQGMDGEALDTLLVVQKYDSRQPNDVPRQVIEEQANAEYSVSIEIIPDEQSNCVSLRLTAAQRVLPLEAAKILLKEFQQELLNVLGVASDRNALGAALSPMEDSLETDIAFLHQFVEESARRQPDSPALEFVTAFDETIPVKKTWSYAALNGEGNRIANCLLKAGISTGDLVATCFDKCPEASFSILGVLKAGCAYVAIDPSAPSDRKGFILEDSGCKIVLTTASLAQDFEKAGVLCIPADDAAMLQTMSDQSPTLSRPLGLEDTCYCLYTSGTTGTPKGCLISHQSAVQAMLSFQRIFKGHWTATSRWLQFASFHFDVSVLEQYWSWSVGIVMVTAPRDLILEDLSAFLRQAEITHLDLTPSLARLISPEEVPGLTSGVFIVGGEQLSQDIIDTWGEAGCLYNFYGPSEVTIGCSVHPRVKKGTRPTNIGQLWANVGAHVLKPGIEEPVIRGGVGELCLTGVLVGKGYLNRPELTRQKFVVLQDGTRAYRTGDLVRLLHDDSFEFLGRIDDQIKLRGQRLEIGEINQVVKASSTEIQEVATMVLKHPKQAKEQLITFFTTNRPMRGVSATLVVDDRSATLATAIRKHCSSKLPAYMVPSSLLMVSNIPLSTNNKIEMKMLKALYESLDDGAMQQQSTAQVQLPESDHKTFQVVAGIIERRLRLEPSSVKPSSRLFELGLDSISAIGLTRALKDEGFEHCSIQAVMRSSLVADLVHVLNVGSDSDEEKTRVTEAKNAIAQFARTHRQTVVDNLHIDAVAIEDISPCTPLQEGMISRAVNSSSGDTTYFNQCVIDLQHNVSVERLEAAWWTVEAACSILRTYFVPTKDGYAQVVLKSGPESQYSPTGALSDERMDWVSNARRFGPFRPWRVEHKEQDDRRSSVFEIFHGLYDGISLDLLLEQVARTYETHSATKCPSSKFYELLPYGPLSISTNSESFWRQTLRNTSMLGLSELDAKDRQSTTVTFSSNARLGDIGALCKTLDVTSPAIFHAAWLLCLQARYSVNPTIGVVVSGRSIAHASAETAIGPMFNTIPSSIEVPSSAATAKDLIRACHKFNMDALPYQHTPLRQIAKWMGFNTRGIFDSLFVFLRERGDAYQHNLWDLVSSASEPEYPINVEVEQRNDGSFQVTLVCRGDHVRQSDCESLGQSYLDLLGRIAKGAHLDLHENFQSTARQVNLSLSSQGERASVFSNPSTESWSETTQHIRQAIADVAAVDVEALALHSPTIFELGLDSIDAMKIATRLKQVDVKVNISAIMRTPTIAGIAAAVQDSRTNEQPESSILSPTKQGALHDIVAAHGIDSSDVEVILPLTSMQQGLLLDYEKYYNIAVFKVSQSLDLTTLCKAWNCIASEVPILRTEFLAAESVHHDEPFLQVVHREPTAVIRCEPDAEVDLVAASMRRQAIKRGLRSPVLQVTLAGKDARARMVVGLPHAAYDGWSIQLLYQSLIRTYQNLLRGDPKLGGCGNTVSYKQHVSAVLSSAQSDEAEQFWSQAVMNTLQSLIPRAVDTHPRPSQMKHRASGVSLSEANKFCKASWVTLQSLGLAAWSLALAKRLQSAYVCFGLVLSGRTSQGSEGLIYPTFNTVVFSINIGRSITGRGIVRRAHQIAMDVSDHQHYPLKDSLKTARKSGCTELFNTLFTYQKTPGAESSDDLLLEAVELDDQPKEPPYAVNIELEAKHGQLLWTLASQSGIFSANEAEECMQHLDEVLHRLVEHPEEPVSEEDEQPLDSRREHAEARSGPDSESHSDVPSSSRDLTQTETQVRDILAEVSRADASTIAKHTNLFNLGLDSISAIKLAALLKKRGMKLAISKILEAQTVGKIAAAIEAVGQGAAVPEVTTERASEGNSIEQYLPYLKQYGLDANDVEDVLPSTAGQQYMLDVWQKSHGRLFYPSFWFEVGSSVTEPGIARAFETLMNATPALRTTFATCSITQSIDEIIQVVVTPKSAQANRDSMPWSYQILHNASTGKKLVTLRIHHALYDAVSMDIVTGQLNRLCLGLPAAPQNSELASFVRATRVLNNEEKLRQRKFWTAYLEPQALTLPSPVRFEDAQRPRMEQFEPRLMPTQTLKNRLRANGVSLQALFFAITGQVHYARMHKHKGSGDGGSQTVQPETGNAVVLGVYLSLRNLDISGLPSLAAPTVNIVPLRVPIVASGNTTGPSSMWEAARGIQQDLALISKAEHCGVSLREIWKWSNKKVQIACVVNFLADMEHDDNEQDGGSNLTEQVVKHASREFIDSFGSPDRADRGRDATPPSPFIDSGGSRTTDMPWCIPSIDIEAKVVRKEGLDGEEELAVGIFGQEDVLQGEDGMKCWLEETKRSLMEQTGDS